ncbi:MAG: hypothetical protein AAF514_00670 [Verrucomicrobiota bacterium]
MKTSLLCGALALTIGLLCQCSSPVGAAPQPTAISLAPADTAKVGQRIWQNECGGTVAGLTSWNTNERFASLGIGHFIWYPKGVPVTYEESFPRLIAYLTSKGKTPPTGITPTSSCPWPNRRAFLADAQSPRMTALREYLKNTVPEQTEFVILRLQGALPKMLKSAGPSGSRVQRQFDTLSKTPNGLYALIDYVNFKGEGTNPKERYQGQGWGLLQVLESMQGQPQGQAAVKEFAEAAKRVLGRRIQLAPKKETQWRAGWFKRCDSYAQPW